jgi:AcrR family transcriptional regulator
MTTKIANKPGNSIADGRVKRSERSRQLILQASLDLVLEGNLAPTALQVAEKAGVGLRTVFRHFADMETLYGHMDEYLGDTYDSVFAGGDRNGTLPERILHAAQQHDKAYENAKQVILSTQAQLWQSGALRKKWARKRRKLRRDLLDWLPEVQSLTPTRQAAAESTMSFETWYHLRYDQGLSHKATVATINETVCLLFEVKPL